MRHVLGVPSVVDMNIRTLHWPLVLGLGALALVRPLTRILGLDVPGGPVLLTVVITAVWVAAVGLARIARPVLTLVAAGLVYGVLAILLSAVLSPILTGELQGPLATPFGFGIVAVLAVNAVWGTVAGLLAAGVQRVVPGRSTTGR
jgi:hypothetical protein